jgi:uncharacterized protein
MTQAPQDQNAAAAPALADSTIYVRDGRVLLGRSVEPEYIELKLANRHGLITGATGTGKTVTLQVLAESFSAAGVAVFAADIKGDLSGVAAVGEPKPHLVQRAKEIGFQSFGNTAFPTVFWDIFGEQGHPVRATVQDMGPLLLSRLLELTDVQEGVLNIAWRWASDQRQAGNKNMLLLDLKDLREVITEVGNRAAELRTTYGNIAPQSIGAIQRRLLVLEEQGANIFFGEPGLDLSDLIAKAPDGRGIINILAADKLMRTPRLYATFLLWMLAKLYEQLPEVGDLDKPKLVFFFDEAHLLFSEAPKALLEKIEQVTRLIRSKGVGVYYVTQNPRDVPDRVSAQLGNRVQHALRAFTPLEQKGIRAAAETFRPNPDLDVERAIQELRVGEALVSTLRNKGEPSIVQRTLIRPPMGRIGPVTPEERQGVIEYSPHYGKYEQTLDRESAYEVLQNRTQSNGDGGGIFGDLFGGGGGNRMGMGEAIGKSFVRSAASAIGRTVVSAILGGKK